MGDQTNPTPLVVDSKGPFYLDFSLIAAKAPNGTPTIGLVDAASTSSLQHWQSSDLSRNQRHGALFSIALSPGSGAMFATMNEDSPVKLQEHGLNANNPSEISAPGCYRAVLNWAHVGNEKAKWNQPIRAGFLLQNRSLTFFRMVGNGAWHSSGVICTNLPGKVVPCVFMQSFTGYTDVRFIKIWDSPPDVCEGCDIRHHGTKNGWWRYGVRVPPRWQ